MMFTRQKTAICKGCAILLLLFHHLFYSEKRVASSGMVFRIFPYHYVQIVGVACRICVWMFVFLSAYGLTLVLMCSDRRAVNRFPAVRWLSLMEQFWPAYVMMCLLMTAAGANVWQEYDENVVHLVLDSLALSDFFGSSTLCNVWWYMCLAQAIVVAIPLVYRYCGTFPLVPGMLAGYLLIQFVAEGIHSPFGGEYINYLLCVLLGCYAARERLFDRADDLLSLEKGYVAKLSALFIVLAVLNAVIYKLRPVDVWHFRSLLQAIDAFGMCLFIALAAEKAPELVENCLAFLGKHSGNIFLIHAFFYTYAQKLVYWSGNPGLSYLSLLIMSLLSSMALEWIKQRSGYASLMRGVIESAKQ